VALRVKCTVPLARLASWVGGEVSRSILKDAELYSLVFPWSPTSLSFFLHSTKHSKPLCPASLHIIEFLKLLQQL